MCDEGEQEEIDNMEHGPYSDDEKEQMGSSEFFYD